MGSGAAGHTTSQRVITALGRSSLAMGHTQQAPPGTVHICPICGHLAKQKKDLKKHFRIHTGEKPYGCQLCPYRSTQNSNLKTHIRRVHTHPLMKENLSVDNV